MNVLIVGVTAQDLLSSKFSNLPKEKMARINWLVAKSLEEFDEKLQANDLIDVIVFLDYLDRGNRSKTAIGATLEALNSVKRLVHGESVIVTSTCNDHLDKKLQENGCLHVFRRPELWQWLGKELV